MLIIRGYSVTVQYHPVTWTIAMGRLQRRQLFGQRSAPTRVKAQARNQKQPNSHLVRELEVPRLSLDQARLI